MRTKIIAALTLMLLSTPNTARAEEKTCEGVELHDGSVVRGVIVEIAADHVTLSVDGAKVTLTWAQIGSFKVGKTDETKAEPETDDEEPASEEVVVIEKKPEAKPVTIVTKPLPREDLEPAFKPPHDPGPFTLGARVRLMAAVEDTRFFKGAENVSDYAAGGVGYELSFALRLSRALLLRMAYEHAELFHGERNQNVTTWPTSDALGIGLRTLFGNAPDVKGVFEVGVGYRWLHVPYASGATPDHMPRRSSGGGHATFEGAESLRLALGSAFTVDEHGRFEILLETALGRFSHVHDENAETRLYAIPEASRETHAFVGISVGVELNP